MRLVETSCGHGCCGWNKDIRSLNFSNTDGGLSGCCYQVLHVETNYNRKVKLTGFKTDMNRGMVTCTCSYSSDYGRTWIPL